MKSNNNLLKMALILSSLYIGAQLIADVAAAKIFMLFGLAMPAGTFIYAVTFTLRDLLHKKLGVTAARTCIVLAGIVNVLMALYFVLTVALPPAPFWPNQEAYSMVIGLVPRIVIASILAEVLSELVDTELYQLWTSKVTKRFQWSRVVFSNAVAVPVDSLLFGFLAFLGAIPVMGILSMAWGQTVFKWVVGLVSMPTIYLVRE